MKKPAYALLLLILLFASFLGGARYSQRDAGRGDAASQGRRVLYYVDPMNPSHTSDQPGFAPCGMPFEPVYADEEPMGAGQEPMAPGTVRITPQKQQLIAVQVGTVERISETHALRTLGRVAPDENRVYRVLAGEDGWMWDVTESTTGSLVQKDQLMGTAYNYLFLARQQQYLYALDLAERRQQAGGQVPGSQQPAAPQAAVLSPRAHQPSREPLVVPFTSLEKYQTTPGEVNPIGGLYYINNPLELAKLELYNLGVGDYQMGQIARTRQIAQDLEIRAPVTGIVLSRDVSPLQRFSKGSELFRVADMSRVWILADVFHRESRTIRPGTRAWISLPGEERAFEAVVSEVPSQFDPATRALKVRLEADNADLTLRPDMFVDVEFMIGLPEALTVPVDAIIDSGLRKTVFVDLGEGFFEPRQVKTGWRFGDRVEVTEGLEAGERIVISGNFLIDSESRMKLAAAGFHGTPVTDPVCGREVYPSKAKALGLKTDHGGASHHFCSVECKDLFDKEHGQHVERPPLPERPAAAGRSAAGPGGERAHSAECPVCGMVVNEGKARAAGLAVEFEGRSYAFCSRQCKRQFGSSPAGYVKRASRSEDHLSDPAVVRHD